MKHLISCCLCTLIMVATIVTLHAQQQPPPAQQPNQPLELPEFIVTGQETIDVPGSLKHVPSKPASIKGATLDSINTFVKQPIPTLPPHALPSLKRTASLYPGYVDAGIGNYMTPDIKAGYSFVADGYRIDVHGSAEGSNGWVDNASYMRWGLGAMSTYVAPDKFIFFGGSTTEVEARVNGATYHQYAIPSAPQRETSSMRVGVNTVGAYDGFNYDAGATWSRTTLSTTTRSVADASLAAHVTVENRWNTWDVGGKIDLDLRSFADASYPFLEAQAYGRYATSDVRLTLGGGVQNAMSTSNVSRFGLLIKAQADYMMSDDLTLQATLRSGLRANRFADFLDVNPYVSDSVIMDAAYDIVQLGGMVYYHPSVRLTIAGGLRIRSTERQNIWVADSGATFTALYATTSTVTIPVDVRWLLSGRDAVVGDVLITSASVSSAKAVPYVPSVRGSVGYERRWTQELRTQADVFYVGDRWADLANTIQLGGYVDLRLSASYAVSTTLQCTLQATNLLGSAITVWQGYQERGMFVRGGITWKF